MLTAAYALLLLACSCPLARSASLPSAAPGSSSIIDDKMPRASRILTACALGTARDEADVMAGRRQRASTRRNGTCGLPSRATSRPG
jgi:hypothetical protein